jgi:hypothetical protein
MLLSSASALAAPDAGGITSARLPASVAAAPTLMLGTRLATAVPPAQLDQLRGGDNISNTATLNGVVANNAAVNVRTGNNIIDGGAFANATGIPVVIQNTGANVLIQNATVINLQLR